MPAISSLVRQLVKLRAGCQPAAGYQPAPQLLLCACIVLIWPLWGADQSVTEQGISAFQHGRYVTACQLLAGRSRPRSG